MELAYDWRSFQSVFYPKKKVPLLTSDTSTAPIYVVIENEIVLSAYSESEDFSECIGSSYQKLASQHSNREIVLFDRGKVDEWIGGSLTLPHYYEQVEYMRSAVKPKILTKSKTKDVSMELLVRRHFLLEALQGWWAKVLPSVYGVFIRLEGDPDQDFFFIIRRGKLDYFHEPDLSSMGAERRRQPGDVVKYLSEKHLVKVQGLFISRQEWNAWCESPAPWKDIAMSIRANRAKLAPFRWMVVTLLATRGFFGI